MLNTKSNFDIDAFRRRLRQHRKYLELAITNDAHEMVQACKRSMCDYLSQLDPLAFDMQQGGLSGVRSDIIAILSEAEDYLINRKGQTRYRHNAEPGPAVAPVVEKCSGRPPARLDSNLVQRTKKLKAISQKMVEHRMANVA